MARGEPVVVLFFNRFFDRWPDPDPAACSVPCAFTADRTRLRDADAVVVHLPTLAEPLPEGTSPGQVWVAWSMESEVTVPALRDPAVLARFDLTMTHRRGADVWMPYVGTASRPALLTPPAAKTARRPVCHFQSNPYDRSGRTRWLVELLKRIKIDSYGTVLPTVPEPGRVRGRDARLAEMAMHKFTLAFENSVAPDYVTDKFFDPLIAGSVPVYLGSPDVADFAPGPHCYLDVADFDGPAALAAHLDHLDRHDDEYQALLAWKHDGLSAEFEALITRAATQPLCRVAELVHARRSGC